MSARFGGRSARQFVADLKKLDSPIQRRILEAIESKLLTEPFKYGKELVGKKEPGCCRFRVGDYRIRFDIEGSALHCYRVPHWREIYE